MKLYKKILLYALCVPFLSTLIVKGQLGRVDRNARIKPAVVILGTYHMGTPGNNVVNSKVDDITGAERQRQVVEVVERLKKYAPTKIVLECGFEADAKNNENYTRYLAGDYQLTKNETNQIGFRLAKAVGLKKVHCVDWSDFWDEPTINYEKYAATDAELDSFLKGIYRDLKIRVDEKHAKFFPLPVVDQLAFINQPDEIEKEHTGYYDYLRIGRGKDYIGANYVAWWYRRNLTILNNVIRLTDSPNDRILVIYGYGHLKLLNQFAKESDYYRVESPLKYLGK